jgi:N-acetylmuramoyl-L-alanine amidase
MIRLATFCLIALLVPLAMGQTLSVNGREVAGLTLSLVEGVSYAPGAAYADALGARMVIDYGSGLVSLEMGGRMAVLPTFTDPEEMAEAAGAGDGITVHVNGVPREGRAAVFDGGRLYLPVSSVAALFLGYTTYVPERERVMVVSPRGRVDDLLARRRGSSERLIVTLNANVPYSVYYNEPLDALELQFDRTESGGVRAVENGRYFRRAAILEQRGNAALRISLEDGVGYSFYTVPDGRGYQLVVDLFERAAKSEEAAPAPPRVVINAAHGGDDTGVRVAGRPESLRALELSLQLAAALEQRGLAVQLTRDQDHNIPLPSRSASGVGADLFLALHIHPAPGGEVAIYYLSEADGVASLDLAIRQNAEAELAGTTDELRRRLLLNLIPDVDVGRRYALGLQGGLFARGGFRVADPTAAPLAVLAGAAGRGLLLELPVELSSENALVNAMADVVADMLLRPESR